MSLSIRRTRGVYGGSPTSKMYVAVSPSHGNRKIWVTQYKIWVTQYHAGHSPFTLRVNSTNHFCAKLLIVESCIGGLMLCESEN